MEPLLCFGSTLPHTPAGPPISLLLHQAPGLNALPDHGLPEDGPPCAFAFPPSSQYRAFRSDTLRDVPPLGLAREFSNQTGAGKRHVHKGNLPLAPSSAACSVTGRSAGVHQGPAISSHQASRAEGPEGKGPQYLPLGAPQSRRSWG